MISKKRVIDICKGICERGLDVIWNCEARADTVDSEVLGWMKKAGCFGVSYGIESVDENVMEKCKKNISDEQVEEAVKITKEAGIQPALFFMIGLPGETEESIRRNIDFAKKMALKYDLRPQCTIATPYPGTEFYDIAKKEGWLRGKIEDLEQTTASIEYPELSKEQLEEWHKKFYVEVVLHPRRLLKRLLRIKHVREVRNIPMHLKEFGAGMLGRMKYVR